MENNTILQSQPICFLIKNIGDNIETVELGRNKKAPKTSKAKLTPKKNH